MTTLGLLQILEELLKGSDNYFISGSLSFLPLVGSYREPGYDLDVSIRKDFYQTNKQAFTNAGKIHVLRIPEVAVANTSVLAKVLAPKTGFIHIENNEGLLDISLFEEQEHTIHLIMGMGIRFEMTKEIMTRRKRLEWKGKQYQAAPLESMFLTKAVNYIQAKRNGTLAEFRRTKHYTDIAQMALALDWEFASEFLQSLKVTWLNNEIPEGIQRKINPYSILDIEELQDDFQRI